MRDSDAYEVALECTQRAVRERMACFRRLAYLFVVLPVGSTALALLRGSWAPLLLNAALLPLVSLFLLCDGRSVHRWRRRVLRLWVDGRMDLSAFREAALHLPMHRQATVTAMLETLPASPGSNPPGRSPQPVRGAVAALARALGAVQSVRLGFAAVMQALVSGTLGSALLCGSTRPLWALLALPALAGLRRVLVTWRFAQLRRASDEALADPEALAEYREAARGLDWSGVPPHLRRDLLRSNP